MFNVILPLPSSRVRTSAVRILPALIHASSLVIVDSIRRHVRSILVCFYLILTWSFCNRVGDISVRLTKRIEWFIGCITPRDFPSKIPARPSCCRWLLSLLVVEFPITSRRCELSWASQNINGLSRIDHFFRMILPSDVLTFQ